MSKNALSRELNAYIGRDNGTEIFYDLRTTFGFKYNNRPSRKQLNGTRPSLERRSLSLTPFSKQQEETHL